MKVDAAIKYELDPTTAPHLTYTYGDGIDWVDQDAFNSYRWRNRSWLYRFWKGDPLSVSPDDYALRRKKLWTSEPEWEVPWPHKLGRPDLPVEEPSRS